MIVAIDVGLKRIGVAIALNQNLVVPSDPILRENRLKAADKVSDMLKEKGATKLIVGLPKGGKSEDEMQRRIEHFISLISFDKEIVFVDEALSSKEATRLVRDKRDGKLDSISAMIILKRYLGI